MTSEFTHHSQRFDLSVEELGEVSEGGAIRAFEGRDWASELEEMNRRADRAETCLPNFGLYDSMTSSGMMVGMTDAETAFFILEATEAARFLGLIPYTRRISRQVHGFPIGKVRKLISMFFRREFSAIKAIRGND